MKLPHNIECHPLQLFYMVIMKQIEALINHLDRLRKLQDKTKGFNVLFIPLKFRNGNNQMSHIKEGSVINDLKVFKVFSRIYLDNFPHIKRILAYDW